MRRRKVPLVIVLTVLTFGIYEIVWLVKTKNEMNRVGATIPTAWWILLPFAYFWWAWKYCEGVAAVTEKELSGPIAYIVLLFLPYGIGPAILQNTYNKHADRPQLPVARVA